MLYWSLIFVLGKKDVYKNREYKFQFWTSKIRLSNFAILAEILGFSLAFIAHRYDLTPVGKPTN